MQLQNAERKRVKLRLNIASPSGFGKTYGALLIANGLCPNWENIAVIDTENESASLYSHLGKFKTICLTPPFSPDRYIEAIKMCEAANIEVIIIDSITHLWRGSGGILEYQQSLGGRYQDWAKATPLYQKWLNAILYSKSHVITTNRKKQGYNMLTENNKTKVEKVGMEDEIRDGYEYEMTLAIDITNEKHLAKPSKDRTELFTGKPEFIITADTGRKILQWCNEGLEPIKVVEPIFPPPTLKEKIQNCKTVDELIALFQSQTAEVQNQYTAYFTQHRQKLTVSTPDQSNHISQHLKTSTNGINRS